jgi:outer membrane biosynthesis protein TonB
MTPADKSHAELRDRLNLARRQLLAVAPPASKVARPGPVLYKPQGSELVRKPIGHGYRWTVAAGVAAAVTILIGAVEFGGASSRPPVPPSPQVAEVIEQPKPSASASAPQPAPAPDPPVVTEVKQEPAHKKHPHAPAKTAAKRAPHKASSHKPASHKSKKAKRTKKRSSRD